jgi:hypothetical protein
MLADRLDCRSTRDALAAIDSIDDLGADDRHHLASCLRCQAAAAQFRRLRRALRDLDLGDNDVDARPALEEHRVLAGVFASLDAYDAKLARRAAALGRAAVVVGGLVVATVGAAGAVVLTRGRRQRLSLAG